MGIWFIKSIDILYTDFTYLAGDLFIKSASVTTCEGLKNSIEKNIMD